MAQKQAVNIKLENRYAAIWRKYEDRDNRIWVRGGVYTGNEFCRDTELPSLLSRIAPLISDDTPDELHKFLSKLNGFFALVVQKGDTVLAAVDRVRSIPLFYGQEKGEIFLSDDAEWIRKNVGDTELDPVARQEFLFTGYVTGKETIFPHVRQLQAGEMLYIDQGDKATSLRTHRYYQFLHSESAQHIDEESLLAELDAVSEKSMERLISYANDRQIVIPLSAGYDSRLIVTFLRRLKYDNVLTFSYGMPGNYESMVSRSVADSLDYEWEFAPYSRQLWRQWWNSKERKDYQWWASGWVSLAHIQDWPAVWHLKQNRKVANNALFVPGHTGDFISGGHIPITVCAEDEASIDELYKFIISKHYSCIPWNKRESMNIKKWGKRIVDCAEAPTINCGTDLANWFEKWEWQERQAKFIINSVRVYEFWGYDWYLPLWDKDFMIFWQKVPVHLRRGKILYDKFVNIAYSEEVNRLERECFIQKHRGPLPEEANVKHENLITRVLKVIPSEQIKVIKHLILPVLILYHYYNEPLARYGRYPVLDYIKFRFMGLGLSGMSAHTFMREIRKYIEE